MKTLAWNVFGEIFPFVDCLVEDYEHCFHNPFHLQFNTMDI